MFDASKIAGLMSGESKKSIKVDMCRCVERTGPGSSRIHMDKLPDVLNDMIADWPAVKEFYDELNSTSNGFNMYDWVNRAYSRRADIFIGISDITFEYPDDIYVISMHDRENIIQLYNEAAEFGDSRRARIEYGGEYYAVIKSVTKAANIGVDDTRGIERWYLCRNYKTEVIPNTELPVGVRVPTPVVLDNNKLHNGIVYNNGEIEVHGDCVVEGIVPVNADSADVVIKGDGRLTLVCTESMQPCIGTRTVTGLSYGRWEPSGCRGPEKITVDGVEVVCCSQVDNFAIGKYGVEKVPAIECINGGRLVCPEATGERIVLKQAKAPAGSTKIVSGMQYGIFREGMLKDEFLSPACKLLAAKLPDNMREKIQFNTLEEGLKEAVRLCDYKKGIDVGLLLDGSKNLTYARTCCMLRNQEIYSETEFDLEQAKIDYLAAKYTNRSIINETLNRYINVEIVVKWLIILVYEELGESITDYACDVLYEMIPSYFFDDWVSNNTRATLKNFVNIDSDALDMVHKARPGINVSETINAFRLWEV